MNICFLKCYNTEICDKQKFKNFWIGTDKTQMVEIERSTFSWLNSSVGSVSDYQIEGSRFESHHRWKIYMPKKNSQGHSENCHYFTMSILTCTTYLPGIPRCLPSQNGVRRMTLRCGACGANFRRWWGSVRGSSFTDGWRRENWAVGRSTGL